MSRHQDGKWGHQRLYGSTEIDSIEVEDMGNKAGYFSKLALHSFYWVIVELYYLFITISTYFVLKYPYILCQGTAVTK